MPENSPKFNSSALDLPLVEWKSVDPLRTRNLVSVFLVPPHGCPVPYYVIDSEESNGGSGVNSAAGTG